ncbi:MAG: PAS domain-containing protein, partial [Novosphingobium sp.]
MTKQPPMSDFQGQEPVSQAPVSLPDAGLLAHRFEALAKALAICQYEPDGTMSSANEAYLALTGFASESLIGQPFTSLFSAGAAPADTLAWWGVLARGQSQTALRRYTGAQDGAVWLREVFVPTMEEGRLVSVLCYAIDVTETHERAAEQAGQIAAINRSHAMIEFDLSGNVLWANDNFLSTMGYSLREIMRQHHAMFCSPDFVRTRDYAEFWLKLNRGEHHAGRFHRVGKYDR